MTSKQESLYWREWKRVCQTQGWTTCLGLNTADITALRHQTHAEALGCEKSHKLFTNGDFDKVLGRFRALHSPGDLNAQLRQLKQDRTRIIHKIVHAVPAAYLQQICEDRFAGQTPHQMDDTTLKQLLYTVSARSNRLRNKPVQPESRSVSPSVPSELSVVNSPF